MTIHAIYINQNNIIHSLKMRLQSDCSSDASFQFAIMGVGI